MLYSLIRRARQCVVCNMCDQMFARACVHPICSVVDNLLNGLGCRSFTPACSIVVAT